MEPNLTPLMTFKEQFNFVPHIINEENLKQHTNVIVCGMGGSAICVSLLKMLFPDLSLSLHNTYGLPTGFQKETTLLIFNSFSGNTEEVLDGFHYGTKEHLTMAALSTGWQLIAQAEATGTPHVKIPLNDLEPRFSIGYQMIGLLSLMGEHEKIASLREKVARVDMGKVEESGKDLAGKFTNKYPVIYASSLLYPVAYLIKAAINEGSKIPCFVSILPEANHNELQSFITDDSRDEHEHFGFLYLRSTYDHVRVSRRFSIMHDLYTARGFSVEVLEKDSTNMVEVFETILIGYFLATYLAIGRNVDPYKTPFVQKYKGILTQ